MNDCKMHKVPLNMANKHIQEYSEKRLYMPKMLKALKVTFSIVVAFVISALVYLWAIPAAYADRGYYSIGGEWILVILAFGLTLWTLLNNLFKEEKNDERY